MSSQDKKNVAISNNTYNLFQNDTKNQAKNAQDSIMRATSKMSVRWPSGKVENIEGAFHQ
ncbi:MAG: hypothetical protein ABI361_00380 [Nitrososphaera sp.]|jgi:hypothetical protein